MDWFQELVGFPETSPVDVQRRLEVSNGVLRSVVNGRSFAIGELELVSLQTLRQRLAATECPGQLTFREVYCDVRRAHRDKSNAGALYQVASQFNLLEMIGPDITPEYGVTRYEFDLTQGPACAIAAGAATIYRNYFVPVGDSIGQTQERQLNGLAEVGDALAKILHVEVSALWTMRNGYALCTDDGLDAICAYLRSASDDEIDYLRGLLAIGVHRDVEVTDGNPEEPLTVSQVFCSALPVAYTPIPAQRWEPFARLVLEAAYEGTLCAGALNASRGKSRVVFLTRLGGGAFGNDWRWIDAAIERSLSKFANIDLDVRLVIYAD